MKEYLLQQFGWYFEQVKDSLPDFGYTNNNTVCVYGFSLEMALASDAAEEKDEDNMIDKLGNIAWHLVFYMVNNNIKPKDIVEDIDVLEEIQSENTIEDFITMHKKEITDFNYDMHRSDKILMAQKVLSGIFPAKTTQRLIRAVLTDSVAKVAGKLLPL